MIKRFCLKKILLSLVVLFAIFLVYVIPNKQSKTDNIKEELIYVNKVEKKNKIFLLDSNDYLASTDITTTKDKINELAKELIEGLIIDSNMQNKIPNGFKALIPANTQVLGITIENNLIKVNFNKELMNTNIKNEERIVEAIVYTLTSLENINKVMILVEDKVLTTLPKSNITLPSTLDRSYGINKEYDINNTNNINKTTIYYLSKFNDNEYYVPVTKINNDNRSKIEIIIDELSSSNVYKTNLLSYLNSNTKILSVSDENDMLTIDFNNAIFNDINTKEILEEVIYTICLSINDNYDVKNIVFNVENEEIYKSVQKTIE